MIFERGREGERNIGWLVASPMCLDQGRNPRLKHMPWLGTEPPTGPYWPASRHNCRFLKSIYKWSDYNKAVQNICGYVNFLSVRYIHVAKEPQTKPNQKPPSNSLIQLEFSKLQNTTLLNIGLLTFYKIQIKPGISLVALTVTQLQGSTK